MSNAVLSLSTVTVAQGVSKLFSDSFGGTELNVCLIGITQETGYNYTRKVN